MLPDIFFGDYHIFTGFGYPCRVCERGRLEYYGITVLRLMLPIGARYSHHAEKLSPVFLSG